MSEPPTPVSQKRKKSSESSPASSWDWSKIPPKKAARKKGSSTAASRFCPGPPLQEIMIS